MRLWYSIFVPCLLQAAVTRERAGNSYRTDIQKFLKKINKTTLNNFYANTNGTNVEKLDAIFQKLSDSPQDCETKSKILLATLNIIKDEGPDSNQDLLEKIQDKLQTLRETTSDHQDLLDTIADLCQSLYSKIQENCQATSTSENSGPKDSRGEVSLHEPTTKSSGSSFEKRAPKLDLNQSGKNPIHLPTEKFLVKDLQKERVLGKLRKKSDEIIEKDKLESLIHPNFFDTLYNDVLNELAKLKKEKYDDDEIVEMIIGTFLDSQRVHESHATSQADSSDQSRTSPSSSSSSNLSLTLVSLPESKKNVDMIETNYENIINQLKLALVTHLKIESDEKTTKAFKEFLNKKIEILREKKDDSLIKQVEEIMKEIF